MIKIYGHQNTSAGRSYWALEEAGVEYEVGEFSFKNGDHRSEEFLAKNPSGKVPVLEDGDAVIWDSSAINYYIAKKYKPELLGSNLLEETKVTQWCYFAVADMQPPVITAFIQKVFVPEERRDQAKIDENLKKAEKYVTILDKVLKDSKYIASDTFTLADISMGWIFYALDTLEYDLENYPNVKRWHDLVMAREAVKRVFKDGEN